MKRKKIKLSKKVISNLINNEMDALREGGDTTDTSKKCLWDLKERMIMTNVC